MVWSLQRERENESDSSDHRHWRRVFRARRFSDEKYTSASRDEIRIVDLACGAGSFHRGMGGGSHRDGCLYRDHVTPDEIRKLEKFLRDRENMDIEALGKEWGLTVYYVRYSEYMLRKIGLYLPYRVLGRPYKKGKEKNE